VTTFETLIVEPIDAGAVLVRLNRPEALNALNSVLLGELVTLLDQLEADDAARCLVLTGSERAFAAGADIKRCRPKAMRTCSRSISSARRIETFRKPIIAAVAGYTLGGGCELAMSATSSSPPRPPSLASRRSISASRQASAAPNG